MDVRRRRSEPQPAEAAEGHEHGTQGGDDAAKVREGDGRSPKLKAIEDAADAARKGEAKEYAQTGARPSWEIEES